MGDFSLVAACPCKYTLASCNSPPTGKTRAAPWSAKRREQNGMHPCGSVTTLGEQTEPLAKTVCRMPPQTVLQHPVMS